jgi:hypothetical protein
MTATEPVDAVEAEDHQPVQPTDIGTRDCAAAGLALVIVTMSLSMVFLAPPMPVRIAGVMIALVALIAAVRQLARRRSPATESPSRSAEK